MAPAPSSAGRSAVVGTFEFATEDGQDGSDGLSTVLGRPISDIVKRVVTVKQVQPFRLAGPGHGYAKRRRGAWSRRREESSFGSRERVTACRRRASRPVTGVGSVLCRLSSVLRARASACLGLGVGELREKGIWWMPWHREAMKDVARCEKPRGGASARGSSDLRMGQPTA